ncbi:MAG: LTA synthase family protein [Chitinophagaceae bacterium]|nr:LTA synthase family protein [Chitinophagaceae bacterium]
MTVGCLFLVVMTMMRVMLYIFFSKQGYSFSELADPFVLGLRYDLRTVALVLIILLVAGSIPMFHPFRTDSTKKCWIFLLGIVAFLLLLFYFIDFAHYSYLAQRLNASVLNYLHDTAISLNMVWQSYPLIKLTIALLLVTALLIWLIKLSHKAIGKDHKPVSKRKRILSFVILFLLFGLAIFGRINQYPLRWSDAFSLGSDYKANLALNPFESFFNTLKFRKSSYDVNKLRQVYPVLTPHFNLTTKDSALLNFERVLSGNNNNRPAPNIILVICESFSGYKSSMWGNPLNTTPFFDSISKKGIFFDQCFTPTYGTARGVWATITGIPDIESPTTASRNPAAVDQHTIINEFNGHEKLYFLGGSASWANIRGLLTNNIRGLRIYEEEDFEAPKIDVWGISDKNLLLEANKIISNQTKPFFAIIQTADNHRPYTIPEEDLTEFKKIILPIDSVRKYGFESLAEMNAFRYTDFGFQKFMEAASRQPYFDHTIFVFVGDHGIPGNAGDMFPRAWTEQRLTSFHVPFLLYAPKLFSPQRNHAICSQVDVLPTIAGLCKIAYRNTTLGRNVLDVAESSQFAFIFDPDNNQTGIIKGDYYYRKNISTGNEGLISITGNENIPDNNYKKATTELRLLTDGIYEASKYLLLNNKKKD